MQYYLAPLEGVTNYIYRKAYHQFFTPLDKYFTPFISTNQNNSISTRDFKELNPEHNQGLHVVPQILSNKAADYTLLSKSIADYGYSEINLNLGCPSNTVVAKNKGSGFLYHTDLLDQFLEEIFAQAVTQISIKTRLGKYDPDEFYKLVTIFNKYPMTELIIHPRIQKDMYKNTPNLKVFGEALSELKPPVCYNGDIFTREEYLHITEMFPTVNRVMLGRGIVGNPALIGQIKNQLNEDKTTFRNFHDTLFVSYQEIMHGEHNVLHKMKELWFYMIHIFTDSKKYAKRIKKCEHLKEYTRIIDELFAEQSLIENPRGYRAVVEGE